MREDGHYWIKFKYHPWQIGYFYENKWSIAGDQAIWRDSDFEEIDERQIKRDEH